MAGNYSGVPSAGVTYGTAIQTGSGGTSNVDDYSVPVYGLNADGQFYRLPAGMTIPAGQTISLATPPQSSATGGSTVTGYGIETQKETKRHNIESETNATNQTANQAASNQNQFAATMAQTASNDRASAQRHEEAMQQFAATMAQNAAEYNLNVGRLGVEQATLVFNQAKEKAANNLLAAQFGMSVANFNLSQNSFNASQRQALADAKLKIDTLLASKRGPDDWVAYNNLLNGMSKPTPTGERVIDPYAGLADMYHPSNEKAPAMPDLSINAPAYTPVTPPPFPSGNLLTGATGSTTSSSGGSSPAAPAYVPPATVQPFGGGTGLTPAAPKPVAPAAPTTNLLTPRAVAPAVAADDPYHSGGNTWSADGTAAGRWTDPNQHYQSNGGAWQNPDGTPYTPMASGGTAELRPGEPVLVGDKAGKNPRTPHDELIYARTGPNGENLIDIVDHKRTAAILDKHHGASNGTVIGAHKLDQNLLHGLRRAADGGEFGGSDQWGGNTPGGGYGGGVAGGNMLYPGSGMRAPTGGPTGLQSPPQTTQPVSAPGTMVNAATPSTTNGTSLGATWKPTIENGGMAYSSTGTGGATSTTSSTAQPATQGTGLSSSNIAAAGSGISSGGGATVNSTNLLSGPNPATAPSTSTGYVPDAPGSYGTANTQPYNVLRTYSPQDLGNQPFLQKILGNMPGRQFGNFGASLDNPSLGIKGMPFNISLQRYNLLAPSEQQQLKSLFEQGLSTPFDDVLAAAQASAPVGHNRQSYAQAIQPAMYGAR